MATNGEAFDRNVGCGNAELGGEVSQSVRSIWIDRSAGIKGQVDGLECMCAGVEDQPAYVDEEIARLV